MATCQSSWMARNLLFLKKIPEFMRAAQAQYELHIDYFYFIKFFKLIRMSSTRFGKVTVFC